MLFSEFTLKKWMNQSWSFMSSTFRLRTLVDISVEAEWTGMTDMWMHGSLFMVRGLLKATFMNFKKLIFVYFTFLFTFFLFDQHSFHKSEVMFLYYHNKLDSCPVKCQNQWYDHPKIVSNKNTTFVRAVSSRCCRIYGFILIVFQRRYRLRCLTTHNTHGKETTR